MADTRVKIVDIQVNIKEAIDALSQYGQAIDAAKARQKELKQELKDGKISQQQYQSAMASSRMEAKANQTAANDLTKQVQNQIGMVKAQEGSIRQLKTELAQATTQYQNMSRAERESANGTQLKAHIASLKTEIASASAETSSLYRNIGNPSQAVKGLDSLKGKAADLVKQIGLIATGGGLVAMGKNIVTTTRNFEDGMARVHAVTNATQAEFQMMEQEALKWGSTTRYTATEASNSLENLTRNGLSAEQATAALGPTLQLAQANTIGLAEAADITTNVMNGFGLEVKDMGRVNDVLSSTASHSATNISQLAEAEKNAAPFGHSLGQSIEEVNASLGVLADVGIKGSDAGSALRMVLMGLASPTEKQQKAFKQLGVDISEQTLRSDGLTKTLEKLRDSGVMKAANSAQLLGDIFGRRVAPQAMALLNNIDGLKSKLDILNNSQGTTQRMFEQSYSDISNSLYGIQSAWEHLLISIGKASDNPLVAVTEAIRKGILWISQHLPEVGRLIMDIISGITFAKLVSSARSAYTEMPSSAISNAQQASAAVQTSQAKERVLRRETTTLAAQLEANKTASNRMSAEQQKLIETQLATKKQQLAVTAANTQKLQATEVAKWNQAQALTTGSSWSKGFAAAGVAARGFVMSCKTAFKGFIVTAIMSLAFDLLMSLYNAFANGEGYLAPFANWLKGPLTKAWRGIVDVMKAVIAVIQLVWAKLDIVGRATKYWTILVAVLGGSFKSTMEIAKFALTTIIGFFKALGNVAKNAGAILADVFTLNWGNIKNDFANLAKSVSDFGKGVADKFMDMSGIIKKNAKDAADTVKNASSTYDKKHSKKVSDTLEEVTGGNVSFSTPKQKKTQTKKKQTPQKPQPQKPDSDTPIPPVSPEDDKEAKKRQAAADKAARLQEQQAKKEQEVLKAAHDAMLATMEDTIEKRRTQIETQYNDEINKLKSRLATERNLTATAREAINQTIKYKEIKKNQELEKLSDENLKQEVARQQKYIDSRLSVIMKGSQEELNLKKQKIEEEKKLSLNNLKNEEKKGILDATEKRDSAKSDMDSAKSKLDKDRENGADTDTLSKDQEAYNAKIVGYQAMQEELTRITAQYEQQRQDIEAKARQQTAQADLEFARQQEADRQQAFQNRLAELEMEGQQQKELQQNLNVIGLDVVTQNEFDKLEVQKQAAQDKLNFMQQFQQQEGETEDEYTQRLSDVGMTRLDVETQTMEARKNLADANTQINQGEIKNEEAKKKAFQTVGTSMISMLDTLGESNSAFAKMSKIITLAQIAIDTGKALSAGIASASSLPYPANLAAIATTVATVLANVATAISTVKSAKFATGGKVVGPGTGTSDSIPAQLSNGEYVMTARATRMFEPMLAAMNNIGAGVPIASSRNFSVVQNTQDMTDSFTEAAQTIRPVVSVEEITNAQSRVETIQSLDNV